MPFPFKKIPKKMVLILLYFIIVHLSTVSNNLEAFCRGLPPVTARSTRLAQEIKTLSRRPYLFIKTSCFVLFSRS